MAAACAAPLCLRWCWIYELHAVYDAGGTMSTMDADTTPWPFRATAIRMLGRECMGRAASPMFWGMGESVAIRLCPHTNLIC
ncbi:hypothetical protein BD413DRAFT_590427 [Trametes elegans]|nr:hypothetical protein BD413DRAFT_590427 [Trametes elegans]